MVTLEEVEQALDFGYESTHFEVKGQGGTGEGAFVAKVARAGMAMANVRDGGLVCIGVNSADLAAKLPGLTAPQVNEWMDYDTVHAKLAKYSDPPISFRPHHLQLSTGAEVVVLDVAQFDQQPHICKKAFQGELVDGQVYVRPRGMPRSAPVPTAADIRDLLELATDIGVREFVRRAGAAGISLGPVTPTQPTDVVQYEAEYEQAWSQPELFSGQAFFDVNVRPSQYDPARLHGGQLEQFLVRNVVRLRGWPVPFVDSRPPERYDGWIGQDVDAPRHREAWRLFASAQFLHRRALVSDMSDSAELKANDDRATGSVVIWDVLLYVVEVVELAARWATELRVNEVVVEVALRGVAGRQLVTGDWKRDLHGPYIINADKVGTEHEVSLPELLNSPRQIAVQIAQDLLQRFGLDVPNDVLLDWQRSIFEK